MGFSIHFNANEIRNTRRFGRVASSLSRTLRNLSSGVRTQARDLDGATLSISERFSTELRAARAELRNVASNTSLLQTLEGALSEATDALQEMREVALSAANSQLSLQDREKIEQRFRGLIDHVYTISEETTYNGRAYLNGDRHDLNLSLVSDTTAQHQTISDELGLLKLPNLDPKLLGKHVSHVGQGRGVFLSPLGHHELEINGVQIRGSVSTDDQRSYAHRAGSAIAKANAINASAALTGVTAKVDMNVYRAFDQLRGVEVDESRWIRINGQLISGISIADQDATGSLRGAINTGFSETGVMASLDTRGQLLLAAPDGRNITIEFSDLELREAFGVRDLYGDDVNFSPDVDPATYTRYGDISSVEYMNHSNRVFATPQGQFNGTFEVLDSKFTKAQDGVDYVFEVVKAGALGQAVFRVKEEHLETGTRDEAGEDYRFNTPGVELTPPTPNKVRITESDYVGASQVRIGLRVLTPGSPQSSDAAEHPEVQVFITSLDDPTIPEVTLGTFTISNTDTLDLTTHGLEAQLTFPVDETRYLLDHQGQEIQIGASITPSTLPDGHDYPRQPQVRSWDGIHSAHFKVEVIESGHALGDRDASFTDETPAKIRVTADLSHQARTIVEEHTLDEHNQVNLIGVGAQGSTSQGSLGLIFPSAYNRQDLTTTINVTGDYDLTPRISKQRYVGEEEREYTLTLTSDGIMSHQLDDGGPTVDVNVYGFDDNGNRGLVQSYQIDELNSDRWVYLGQGDERDGLALNFRNSPVVGSVTRSRDVGGDLHFSAYRYNDLSEQVAVVKITKAGIDVGAGAAEYEYFYQDDPDTIIETGSLSKYTIFSDGTYMRSWASRSYRSTAPHIPTDVLFIRDGGYARDHGGAFVGEVIEIDGDLFVETTWAEGTPEEEVFITDFHTNQYLSLGHGVQAKFDRDRIEINEIDETEITFAGEIAAPNYFQVDDTFTYRVHPNLAREGDTYTLNVKPVDLVAGAVWRFQAIGPDWKPGDVYYADLGTGFDAAAFTLTDTLTYPVDEAETTLGEIRVSGHGRFEVGDQIRVGTRAFVGEVRTTGAYASPEVPTDYVLKVTRGGTVEEAEMTWERADGLTDTEHGGQGALTGLTLGEDAYIEEGISVSFHDRGEGVYLAQGDEIKISVGRNLKYTFGGQISLHAHDEIELTYADATVDRQLGKVLFTGSDEEARSPRYHHMSSDQAVITARADSSLQHAGVMSRVEVMRAVETVDAALAEISEARASLGASLGRLERQQETLLQKVTLFSGIRERLVSVDYASAIASKSAAQIQMMSAPQLMQVSRANALRVLDLITRRGVKR